MNLPLVIASIVLPTLTGIGALLRTKSKGKTPVQSKISVQLDAGDHDRLRKHAERHGQTLSQYVRNTLVESIDEDRSQPARVALASEARDAAHRLADQSEALESKGTGTLGFPPSKAPEVVQESVAMPPVQARVLPMLRPAGPAHPHPCQHLGAKIPFNMKGQCQGTCQESRQKGRICFWTHATAASCPFFEPKRKFGAGAQRAAVRR